MALSRKILAQIDGADFRDITRTGYRFTLYADGHIAAEYRTRWQGGRDGARYVTDPGQVDPCQIDDTHPDTDAEAKLVDWIQGQDPAHDIEAGHRHTWRQTRAGYIIR